LQAKNFGLHVEEHEYPGFTDYESALIWELSVSGGQFVIGGVVFSGPYPRITFINGFE